MNDCKIALMGIAAILVVSCYADCPLNRRNSKGAKKLNITSPAFVNNQMIPVKYTCDGANVNPPLQISGIPAAAKSLAIVVDDPDAPKKPSFVHWLVWNIPPTITSIAEKSVPGVEGVNDFGKKGYGGACPPSGIHHYFFKVYALDTMLDLPAGSTQAEFEKAMNGHVLAQASFVWQYGR